MAVGNVPFDDLLKRLEEARFADEETHSRESSLAERIASRDALMAARAEMASFRSRSMQSATESPR